MRIASGASGVLVGLYLADLADRGFGVNPALVGTLGAIAFASELATGMPMGVASDALAPRALTITSVLGWRTNRSSADHRVRSGCKSPGHPFRDDQY